QAGQRLARQGRHAEAVAAWAPLLALQSPAFAIVAADYAASAQAAGQAEAARRQLQQLLAAAPTGEVLAALLTLEPDAAARRALLAQHLQRHPALSTSLALLREIDGQPGLPAEVQALQHSLAA